MDRGRAQVPAVGLVVTAGLDALFALAFLFLCLMDLPTLGSVWGVEGLGAEEMASHGIGVVLAVVGLVIDAIIASGGLKMMKLQSYGFAVAAALLATIPCLASPCLVLGIPFGIWSLYVLMDPEVKKAFEGQPPAPPSAG